MFSDQQLLQMALPQATIPEIKQEVKMADYSQFLKKKVTINAVEKQVKKYDLDEDEVEHKRRKGKKR